MTLPRSTAVPGTTRMSDAIKGGKNVTFVIVDAPSVLGLRPNGVEKLPEALKAAGLRAQLRASIAAYGCERDFRNIPALQNDLLRSIIEKRLWG
jgi:hypothetical protein